MLKGKSAIVTGSTSGIGLAVAHAFAEQGCNIVFNGLGEKSIIDALVADTAKKYGVKTVYSPADMTKPEQIRNMIKLAESSFGGPDILINNAGIQFTSPVEEFPEDKWDAIIAINLTASFHSMKAAIPGMRKRGYGRIVNIASVHGLVASKNKGAYVAAKHGLMGLTKVVALENAEFNITCTAICPGWVHTPLVDKQIQDKMKAEGLDEKTATARLIGEKQPNQRFTRPEQIGELAVFLCSDTAATMTGVPIAIDGGWTAQ